MEKQITINGHKLTIKFSFVGNGQNPKCYSFINDKKWVSLNSFNVKKDPTHEMNWIVDELRFGAYKMFI
jgi:hypothetical protein